MNTQVLIFMVFVSIITLMFLIFSWLLIKRNRNRFSISLALYFITTTIGLIINLIYRMVDSFIFNIIGNLIVIIITAYAGVHLLSFNLLLVKSTKNFSKKKQIILNIIYLVILFGLVLIQFITGNGIKWQFTDNGALFGLSNPPESMEGGISNPVYSKLFGLYGLIASQIVWITILYLSIKIKKKMGSSIYGKKYKRNIIGILFFDLQLIFAFIAHTSNLHTMRMIALILQLGTIPGAFFLYYGLKKAPE